MYFLCPNCGSKKFLSKHSIGKSYKEGPYINVKYEIQCSECFMDIPSNLCENINVNKINYIKKVWNEDYKPIHLNDAAECSKCFRKYWDIEKYLFLNNESTKDIFYQTFNSNKEVGDLICKICDPTSFK
tara:strand:+ start:39 stop:425 length:387 start_codon:yes stop_codon:yes gene_type:complete